MRPFPDALRARYLRAGYWDDRTIGSMLLHGLGGAPELEFRIWSQTGQGRRSSFGQVREQALRLAATLQRLGIGPGDAICVYLPNTVETAIAFVAATTVGAAIVPAAPYYGMHELRPILRRSQARMLITAESTQPGRLEQIQAMRADLPQLEHVVVAGTAMPAGMQPLADLLRHPPLGALPQLDPDGVALIAFTSGTTSEPKGVVHTHRSLCCEAWLHMDRQPRGARPRLTGGPVAHVAGMLGGLVVPMQRRTAIHLMDAWKPELALSAMRECDLVGGSGAPVFINTLLNHVDTGPDDIARIDCVGVGGAPVPLALMQRCEELGVPVYRLYGLTEHPTISMGDLADPVVKRMSTEGRLLPGVELRIVDANGTEVGPGENGLIFSRGPDLCAGYLDPDSNAEHFDKDGWFCTGDVGMLDEEGYLSITDRQKDLIVRNGIKIGPLEIESLLQKLPGVQECAVIGVPDTRSGERVHAVLRSRAGAKLPGLDEIREHLRREGLARQKWPESIEQVDDFPRTVSGKIRKAGLRQAPRQPL